MGGYKGKDTPAPQVLNTPELLDSRRKEDLKLHQAKVKSLQDDAKQAETFIKGLDLAIVAKGAEFDALVIENNNILQGIQADIRVAWEAVNKEKGVFSEHVKEVEADLLARQGVLGRREAEHLEVVEKLHKDNSALLVLSNQLEDREEALEARELALDNTEAAFKKKNEQLKETLDSNLKETARLDVKSKELNDLSTKVDTARVQQSNTREKIIAETAALKILADKVKIDQAEYDRVQKLVEETEKQQADFNARGDWLANKDAELKTYERALRIKDARIQEREGKVEEAETRIAGD